MDDALPLPALFHRVLIDFKDGGSCRPEHHGRILDRIRRASDAEVEAGLEHLWPLMRHADDEAVWKTLHFELQATRRAYVMTSSTG